MHTGMMSAPGLIEIQILHKVYLHNVHTGMVSAPGAIEIQTVLK
jgi:hypothetical protein